MCPTCLAVMMPMFVVESVCSWALHSRGAALLDFSFWLRGVGAPPRAPSVQDLEPPELRQPQQPGLQPCSQSPPGWWATSLPQPKLQVQEEGRRGHEPHGPGRVPAPLPQCRQIPQGQLSGLSLGTPAPGQGPSPLQQASPGHHGHSHQVPRGWGSGLSSPRSAAGSHLHDKAMAWWAQEQPAAAR